MRILAPGIAKSAFRHDRAEVRVRNDVHPRSRRRVSRCRCDDVFASVRREPSGAVAEDQISSAANPAPLQRCGRWVRVGMSRGIRGAAAARRLICSASVPRLSVMIARATDWKRTRSSVDICSACRTKMPPGRSTNVCFDTGSDQPDDLFLELLPIARRDPRSRSPDPRPALEAPVGMRLHELAHEFDIGGVGDLQQHDRQVSGDRVAPEAGLPAAVL